jgi:hypothetical protein
MVEPGRREAASAGNSMMVPMFVLSGCHTDTIWPATCHYSEQNVVNGILICAGGTVTGLGLPRKLAFYRISSRAVFLNQLLKCRA